MRAARLQGAKGYLLWNASGLYTKAALAPALVDRYGASLTRDQPTSARS